jgi:cell division initiation protein
MTISPVELHHIGLKRSLFGYRCQPVDRLIEEIADSFEEVWRQRADFADRIEQLEAELERHRQAETLLRSTLVSAERSALEQKDQARREAGLIVEEAHSEARAVTREAAAERERLLGETRKIRALLEAALDAVDDGLRSDEDVKPEAA